MTGEACGAADIWHAFADSTNFTQAVVPEQSGTALGEYPVGVFGRAQLGRGCEDRLCDPDRIGLSLAASLAWLRHGHAAFEPKASALATVSLLAMPYVLDYDLVCLRSIALLACHACKCGFRDYEISVLATAWIVPLISRGLAGTTGIPLGLILMLVL